MSFQQPQYEYTLLQKQNIKMFKIPPASSPGGHLLASWKETVWTGNVRVIGVGEKCIARFVNFDGSEYAKAVIADNFRDSVQKTVDSSRGYAIKLTSDDGRSMWVGLGFHDRNDGFDFFAAFEDFQKKREMERNPHLFKATQHRHIDYSLQPGQLIHLNIGGEYGTVAKTKPTDSLWDNPFEAHSKNPFKSSDFE